MDDRLRKIKAVAKRMISKPAEWFPTSLLEIRENLRRLDASNVDLASLVSRYEKIASEHPRRLEDADPKGANRLFDEIRELAKKIAGFGDEGIAALAPFLDSEDPGVRYFAATHLLGVRECRATQVLAELAESKAVYPLLRFTARQTLRAWSLGGIEPVFPR